MTDDRQLLDRMFEEHNLPEGEIFRRVYGIDASKYLEQFYRSHALPAVIRDFCTEQLVA